MKTLYFIFLTLLGCSDSTLVKHTVEEKYIYPSYYDVYVEDSGIIIEDTEDEEQFPVWIDSFRQPSEFNGVDILWVIDPSGSMNNEKQYIIAGIEAMILALPNVNWRLVIISTDRNNSSQSMDFLMPLRCIFQPLEELWKQALIQFMNISNIIKWQKVG